VWIKILSPLGKGQEVPALSSPSVRLERVKELIIKEVLFFDSVEDLARFANIAAGGRPTGIYWAGGVAFLYYPLPLTTRLTASELIREGRLYWAMVCFSLMPDYRRVIETKEKIMVPVLDVSSCLMFKAVAEKLKELASELGSPPHHSPE